MENAFFAVQRFCKSYNLECNFFGDPLEKKSFTREDTENEVQKKNVNV